MSDSVLDFTRQEMGLPSEIVQNPLVDGVDEQHALDMSVLDAQDLMGSMEDSPGAALNGAVEQSPYDDSPEQANPDAPTRALEELVMQKEPSQIRTAVREWLHDRQVERRRRAEAFQAKAQELNKKFGVQ